METEDLLDPASAWAAVKLACRAPSVHNTQPWRWRIGPTTLHLFADPGRRLAVGDPYDRDLVLSCGAALHHLQVALRAAGWRSHVHRLPDRTRPDHLAAVEVHPWDPTEEDVALAAAIPRRRTDRRRFTSWPVPPQLREEFCDLAARAGALLLPLDGADERWRAARIAEAANVAGPLDDADEVDLPLPNTAGADLAEEGRRSGWADDGTWLALLVTRDDSRLAHLRAGEALSAILLDATRVGLAAQPVTQVFAVPELRSRVAAELAEGAAPQVLLRLGWPAAALPPVPETGRRPVRDVVDPWDAPWPDTALLDP